MDSQRIKNLIQLHEKTKEAMLGLDWESQGELEKLLRRIEKEVSIERSKSGTIST